MRKALRRFERGAEKSGVREDGILRLVGYDVAFKSSELLLEEEHFTEESFHRHFAVKTGEWYVEDGWVVGKNPEMFPGMIVSKGDFFGNIMVEITAKTVAPCTHDINVMIHGEWDQRENYRKEAYVAGLEAFWHGNVGFEKSPEYKLTAATQLFEFDPEKEHRFQMGNINGKIFVIVDGQLCLEITDPEPLDIDRYGKIGFEAYSSWWKFKDLKVRRLEYREVPEYYNAEF